MSFGAIASRLSGLDAGRHRPSSTTGVIAALTLSSLRAIRLILDLTVLCLRA